MGLRSRTGFPPAWPARAMAAVIGAAALLAACGGDDDDETPPPTLRDTTFGPVQGQDLSASSGTYAWKGVPYAKPPVDALRWKAPVDPDAWSGTPRLAQQFAPACVQYGRIYGPGANNTYDASIATTLNTTVGSEDCLYLNIWRPATADAALPVLVFIHGGSNVSGYTADPVYDGAALARTANAVVVTVNYRLGIFGWLNLPQLKDGSSAADDSGNFATLDTIHALRFVNRNIARFGGDAGNVTVMGQSAGAINVYALLTAPQMVSASPKLMHKAVAMSGGFSLATTLPPGSLPTLNPASTALAQGNALLQQQVIADGLATDVTSANAWIATQTPAQVAAYLRGKTPATLLTTLLTRLVGLGLAGSGPIPEGTVVPTDPIAAIRAGNYLKVPVIASTTRDEAKLFPTFLALAPALGGISGRLVNDATLFNTHFNYDPDAAPTVTLAQWIPAAYLPVDTPVTGFNARTDLLNTIFFIASRNDMMAALKTQQDNVWYYRFDWDEEPAPWNDIYGAAHAFDLPFVFGNFGPSLFAPIANSTANRPGRLALSDAMMKSLGAFARNGDPNHTALGVTWPVWPAQLRFDASTMATAITVQ